MNEITNEQSSPTQQHPKSPEVVGTSLQRRAGSFGFQKLGEYFESDCGSYETTGLLEELSQFAQTISNEKPGTARANELLHTFIKQKKHGSRANAEVFKRKNHRHKLNNAKRDRS